MHSNKYLHTDDIHNLSAPNEIVPFLIESFRPKTVIDVGCGTGTFLSVFVQRGITDVVGIDGTWVKREQLLINQEKFITKDLEMEFTHPNTFDLVLCLEVAEHLKETSSDSFVKSLTSLGKVIVFSAAVKNQGGQNHINEQDYSYWQQKFGAHGYSFYDIFRNRFWNNENIDWWYKQNMFLVAHHSVSLSAEFSGSRCLGDIPVFIHPSVLITRKHQINQMSDRLHKLISGNAPLVTYLHLVYKRLANYIVKKKAPLF